MENLNCDSCWPGTDEMLNYTGENCWNAVYTMQLGELIEMGLFSWEDPALDWSAAAYDDAQYKRVCDYFVSRFKYREISIVPLKQWKEWLHTAIVFELMPKYKPLYDELSSGGIIPLADKDEYYKGREIGSNYPETLLAGNADYISTGKDEEFERVTVGNVAERLEQFVNVYKDVDNALLDELESFFICMYTANVNGF